MKKANKPEIIVAAHAGFCFGVRRAVELAEKALKKGVVYSCGSLIHNPKVIADLQKKGYRMVDEPAVVPEGSTFIVRSHGTTKEMLKIIRSKKAKIIDATCPFVKRAQRVAAEFRNQGWQVAICGDLNHAEVIGINSYAGNKALVIGDAKETKAIDRLGTVGLLSQTTQKIETFKRIATALIPKTRRLVVENTICLDTSTKQKEVKELAGKVDVMIVVGGKNSSNTTKLAQVAAQVGVKTYHIEDPAELKVFWLEKANKIGIAAGASTPGGLIGATRERVEKIINDSR